MDNVVTQLQYDVLDSQQDTATILRKAYLISRKLNLSEFENWVSSELNGYNVDDKIPDYRKLQGRVRFHNPYHGWRPALFADREVENNLSVYLARESIPKIIDLTSKKGQLQVPIPTDIAISLTKNSNAPTLFEYAIFLDDSSLRNIVDVVRTKILDWAILLENNGIQGEGLKFTKDEITNAKDPSITYYTNNFYGPVEETQIQQGTDQSNQSSNLWPFGKKNK